LYAFRNREYSPTLGRWTRNDPIEYEGGLANIYSIGYNNPPKCVDPSGLFILKGLNSFTRVVRSITTVAVATVGAVIPIIPLPPSHGELMDVAADMGLVNRDYASVFHHPLCGYRALQTKLQMRRLFDERYGGVTYDTDDTVANAVKHCTLSCYLASSTTRCSKKAAWRFVDAHEWDEPISVSGASKMDRFNNRVGYGLAIPGQSMLQCMNACQLEAQKHRLLWLSALKPGDDPQGILPTTFPYFDPNDIVFGKDTALTILPNSGYGLVSPIGPTFTRGGNVTPNNPVVTPGITAP
jgi:hypothetical protein